MLQVPSNDNVYLTNRCIIATMKRLQIYIDEDLDQALAVQALREKRSKAALIRQFVREKLYRPSLPDPLDALAGSIDEEAGDIDEVVYRR